MIRGSCCPRHPSQLGGGRALGWRGSRTLESSWWRRGVSAAVLRNAVLRLSVNGARRCGWALQGRCASIRPDLQLSYLALCADRQVAQQPIVPRLLLPTPFLPTWSCKRSFQRSLLASPRICLVIPSHQITASAWILCGGMHGCFHTDSHALACASSSLSF